LHSVTDWTRYCKSGKKPSDIPADPNSVYAEEGWCGWGDWLGTGAVAYRLRQYRSLEAAREFVRSLGLKSQADWIEFCNSAKKPADIPSSPEHVYAKKGWIGMGDWLGTGVIANRLRQYRSLEAAREFVRRLGLQSRDDWKAYCKSGKKPADIPAAPWLKYANDGWAGMGDWLGTGRHRGTGWQSFKDARAYVRGLGLKSVSEWNDYCRLGKKPANIPTGASQVYAKDGWAGWRDWLGTERVATHLRQ
jgi:hypothetical protein